MFNVLAENFIVFRNSCRHVNGLTLHPTKHAVNGLLITFTVLVKHHFLVGIPMHDDLSDTDYWSLLLGCAFSAPSLQFYNSARGPIYLVIVSADSPTVGVDPETKSSGMIRRQSLLERGEG